MHFDLIRTQIIEKASQERGVIGGSYEVSFFFVEHEDFLVLTPNGQIQAKGKDEYHVYMKPWEKSRFSTLKSDSVLETLSSLIDCIEVKGCGNAYVKRFQALETFLSWLESSQQLDLFDK